MQRILSILFLCASTAQAATTTTAATASAPAALPVATAVPATVPAAAPMAATRTVAPAPTAAPLAAPVSATAAPVAAAPKPTPAATPVPSIYKTYMAPENEAAPKDDGLAHVTTSAEYRTSWGLALRGGGALPLGDLATYNGSGGSGGLDVLYHANEDVTVDIFSLYSSQGYKLGGGASPLTVMGGGIKLDYQVMRVELLNAWVGAGGGYCAVQRTQQVLQLPVLNNPPQYTPTTQSTGGVALMFCAGAGYEFHPRWTFIVELDVLSLSLGGGTSDSLMIGLPNGALSYTF